MAEEKRAWYDYLNPWSYISPTGELNPFAIQGAEKNTDIVKNLVPSLSEPKSLILPVIIIGGIAAFLLIKK